MAFANDIANPQSLSLAMTYSYARSAANGMQLTIVPRNPDGSIFDCTDATDVACYLDDAQLFAAQNANPATIVTGTNATLVSHDGTGVVISLTGAQATAVLEAAMAQGVRGGNFAAFISDGALTILGAKGTWAIAIGA